MNPSFVPDGNVFGTAVQWLQMALLGTIATAVAVIAVASFGFLLLSGRIDVRRGAQVILGCFIVFGASSMAAGIMRMVHEGSAAQMPEPAAPPPPPTNVPVAATKSANAVPYDPYAGAALPSR